MTQITITTRLVTTESTRHHFWQLTSELNTPLANELIEQVKLLPELETWKQKGTVPTKVFEDLANRLKDEPRFKGQPPRLYVSAARLVHSMFESWLAAQKDSYWQLKGKLRWLGMLKSDDELIQISGCDLSQICDRAAQILKRVTQSIRKSALRRSTSSDSSNGSTDAPKLSQKLFELYDKTGEALERCAISYLLKNGCKLSAQEEDPAQFKQRYRKTEIQIQRLQKQVEAQLPMGRDLTDQRWLEALAKATSTVPHDEAEAKSWKAELLRRPKVVPYPIFYRNKEDLVWSCDERGRLCVHFNGLAKHIFKIYCHCRQLHWFKRLLEDQQTKRNSEETCSSSLFTLRSAHLVWHEGAGKGAPWNVHHLYLHCTVETHSWTAEGTDQLRQEEKPKLNQKIARLKEKEKLSKGQQDYLVRLESQLEGIDYPFKRPSRPPYQFLPNIMVGISMGLADPATLAVVDITTQQVLVSKTIRELLGKNYGLLLRRRREQQRTAHQRHKAQKRSAPNQFGESALGQYVDRLIAKEIVAIAKTYQANSIVVPELAGIREVIECEMQAKAEQKCPGYLEGQKKYAKEYRANVHQWSYGRLIDNVRSQAAKLGIATEQAKQSFQGTQEEKAKSLAIAAYQARK